MYQIARLLISISPALMGAYLIFGELSNMAASSAASNWPKAPGTVIEVKADHSAYFPQSFISYDYEVKGIIYIGNRIKFGGGSASGYYANEAVDVSYNPHNYNEAVLETGLSSDYIFRLTVGIGLVLVGKLLWKRLE